MGPIPAIDGSSGARLPLKPVYGTPCNGCGFCCAAEPCGIARQFIPDHPEEGPCRAMEFEGGRFVCGMIRRPGHYIGLPDWGDPHMGALFAGALGAGKGCDADDLA
ncbi:hypothetical protein [Methylobacterium sp. J-068]|uniref:hypothetical protein n=1 Tax=Methylobacterium sp. J-068 TaxID=2836649 RepID=UPI001FBA35BC|nr:hypothetical protein [Methylobacterium sp. J-068]